jgi:serine protease Do
MRPVRLAPLALFLLATTSRGQQTIPPKTMTAIKGATVFVKTKAGEAEASGSGFVMRVEKGVAFVVTNHHVVTPPARSTRGSAASVPAITVVFDSGTKAERSARAEVLNSDPGRDLALLKVDGVKDLPRPIDFNVNPLVTEKVPVLVFGFPSGAAPAASKKGPAVAVGRGKVSSLGTDNLGRIVRIVIDGAIHPGNSGGPVVDAGGQLIGVGVATTEGAKPVGFAVPRDDLVGLLDGRVVGATASLRKLDGKALEFDVEARLVDPINQIKLAYVLAVPGDKTQSQKAAADGTWRPLEGAKQIPLKVANSKATGTAAVMLDRPTASRPIRSPS